MRLLFTICASIGLQVGTEIFLCNLKFLLWKQGRRRGKRGATSSQQSRIPLCPASPLYCCFYFLIQKVLQKSVKKVPHKKYPALPCLPAAAASIFQFKTEFINKSVQESQLSKPAGKKSCPLLSASCFLNFLIWNHISDICHPRQK